MTWGWDETPVGLLRGEEKRAEIAVFERRLLADLRPPKGNRRERRAAAARERRA